jgi:hypothetical protein
MLRGIASGLPEWRRQIAGASVAAPASAPVARPPPASPVAPSVAPTPPTASEWSAAWTRLAAKPGPRTLAQGLVALLDVRAAADLEQIAAFEAAVRRLRWNSALALGSRSGMLSVGHAQGDSKPEWAEERALAACRRTAGSSCKIVFANGEYRADDFAMLAAQFGSRPQAQVRQAFLESTRRSLEKGL